MNTLVPVDSNIKGLKKLSNLLQDISSSALLASQDLMIKEKVTIRHGFEVNNIFLLVPTGGVISEIIVAPSFYSIPNTPSWFKGFINHRGETLPVFYLEALFNPEMKSKSNQQWILILKQNQRTSSLLLNSYPYKLDNLRQITLEDVTPMPKIIKPYVQKVFYDGKNEWLDFQHHPFLLSLHSKF